jgi:5-carboxymethyl-2-hydroxymuconate isomerase
MRATSRWFIFGGTGIGKTLFAMEMAAAIADAAAFLMAEATARARDVSRWRVADGDVQRAHAIDR